MCEIAIVDRCIICGSTEFEVGCMLQYQLVEGKFKVKGLEFNGDPIVCKRCNAIYDLTAFPDGCLDEVKL